MIIEFPKASDGWYLILGACGWAAGWGTDKAKNWLCQQMIAANHGKATYESRTVAVHPQPSWGRPLTFESVERLRSTPSRA